KVDPSHDHAWYNRGVVLFNGGRVPEAVQSFKESVAIEPSDPQAWLALGEALIESEKPADATDALQHALDLNPQLIKSKYLRAATVFATGNWTHARSLLSEALESVTTDETLLTVSRILLRRLFRPFDDPATVLEFFKSLLQMFKRADRLAVLASAAIEELRIA